MVFKTVASSSKTVVDLTDAYTVSLSNESVSIACDVAGTAIAGELGAAGKAIAVLSVYKGSLALTPVAAGATPGVGQYKYIVGTTTGSVVTRTNDSTFYIASVSADSGTVPVTIYLEGTGTTVSKLLTWNKSKTGATGAVGTSVSSIVEEYYLSTSNSSQTGGTWSTTAPTWTQGTYIWTRSKINYINPTSTVTTSPICVSGSTGNTGTQGISITAVDVFYYLSTSNTSQTGGTWNTTAPTWTDGSYIWSKTRTTYSNASTTESTPACITGGKGATGTAGRSVTSVIEEYYYSTSSSSQTGDTWGTAVPAWVDGKFLWTRTKTTFSDASNSTTTPVCVTGQKGTDGIIYYNWVKYADNADGTIGLSDSPVGKRYLGFATGKTSATESTTPGDYAWSPLYDNVVVGGTNLWLNSTPEKSYANWTVGDGTKSLEASFLWNGKKTLKFVKASAAAGGVSNSSVRSGLPASTQFAYSFMAHSTVSMPINNNSLGHMQVVGTSDGANVHRETAITYSPSTLPANVWTKVTIVFSTPAPAVANETFTFRSFLWYLTYGATYYFADFQLEKGNISSDWTPAPEDIQTQIDSSVLATDVEYYLSTSTSSAVGGSWVTTAPAWTTGKYMWTRTKVTTNAGVVSYRPDTNGTCIAGAVGATGGIGNTGIGVSAIVEQYYLSTSNSSQAGSSWGTAMPVWVLGKFLWTRSAVTWTDASTTYTTPVLANALNTANETANTALEDAAAAAAYAERLNTILNVENATDTYFAYDKNLTSSDGVAPLAGYTATLVSSGKFGQGVSNIGQALYYDKSILPLAAFTISGWFNPILIHTSGTGTTGINTNWYFPLVELAPVTNLGSASYGFGLSIQPDAATYYRRLELRSPVIATGTTSLNNGTWYHIAVVFDGASYKVYLNGELEINAASAVQPQVLAGAVFMAGGGYCGKSNLKLDDLFVSSRIFTQEELKAVYTLDQPFYDNSPIVVASNPQGVTISIT